ncbi:hypothetical protein HBB16_05430 [Pseudonocardia sp. MCCB 268]|nr:hypothetical protein [Pseudonocardia cytotoxica]
MYGGLSLHITSTSPARRRWAGGQDLSDAGITRRRGPVHGGAAAAPASPRRA